MNHSSFSNTTEQHIANTLDELVSLVAQGKPMDAFEKFYHQDLEKTDLDGVVVTGKDKSREIGWQLLTKVSNVRDFSRIGQITHGNRSFLVWSLDFDHVEAGQVKMVQVAIQDWKIIRERFYA